MSVDDLSLVDVAFPLGAAELNNCENLLAIDLREIEELTLQVVLTEAKAQAPIKQVDPDSRLGSIFLGSRPIESDASCRIFRLVFLSNQMVSWSVLNECYGRYPEPPAEVFSGRLFRAFSRSHLLDYTTRITNASDGWPGPLQHYQIACCNHVIDVIATGPPQISVGFKQIEG